MDRVYGSGGELLKTMAILRFLMLWSPGSRPRPWKSPYQGSQGGQMKSAVHSWTGHQECQIPGTLASLIGRRHRSHWIPACAGMTRDRDARFQPPQERRGKGCEVPASAGTTGEGLRGSSLRRNDGGRDARFQPPQERRGKGCEVPASAGTTGEGLRASCLRRNDGACAPRPAPSGEPV